MRIDASAPGFEDRHCASRSLAGALWIDKTVSLACASRCDLLLKHARMPSGSPQSTA